MTSGLLPLDASPVEAPDVNAPYPKPPMSIREYARRLVLAIGGAGGDQRIKMGSQRDFVLPVLSEKYWPEWYAWFAYELDEFGREVPGAYALPAAEVA